jgi:Skp family chaperone for outer membrane proteins
MLRAPSTRAAVVPVLLMLAGAFSANLTHAQTAVAKIGVANPSKIFSEIQETKDFVAKMKSDVDTFKAEQNSRAQKLKDIQTQLDMFKQDSPQFVEADKKLLDMSIEFEIYARSYQTTIERRRKDQIIKLYKKITAAVAKVATQKGLDFVAADVQPDLPTDQTQLDQVNENTLNGLLAQRDVLYCAESIDISMAVIVLMDTDYGEGK